MGTQNFMIENASSYFVVEEEEFEEVIDFDEWKNDVSLFFTDNGYDQEEFVPENDNRSFPSQVIASKTVRKDLAENPIEITFFVVVRSGYYAGVCFDWSFQIETTSENFFDEKPILEDIKEEYIDVFDFSKGFATIQSKNVINFIDKTLNELKKETEILFSKLTTEYKRIAVASNGEAFYEKV